MKKIFIFLIVSLFSFANTFSYENNIETKTKNVYNLIYKQITKTAYNDNKKLNSVLNFKKLLQKIYDSNKVNYKNNELLTEIQELNNEKIFNLRLKIQEKNNKNIFAKYPILSNFKHKIYNKNFLFKENWVWYTYSFENKHFFESLNWLTKNDFIWNWLDFNTDIVYSENQKIYFLKNFKKVRLISDDIIFWVSNKYYFLEVLSKDKYIKKNWWNFDSYFTNLRNISEKLTKWIYKNQDKIKKIYDYVLKNTHYSKNIDWNNFSDFSWIMTFINKKWVCEWYVKLFSNMLAFNWIDAEIIYWDVINAKDFPNIWHAWIKIWNYYYDPTFDDPVWTSKDREYKDYHYFKIPRDLFYTNRFDDKKTPENLKTKDLDYRELYVLYNLKKVFSKYKNSNYNLLKELYFKDKLDINLNSNITLTDLLDKFWYKEVKNFKIVWENKYISNINFYEITNQNIWQFLEAINYNLDWYQIFKWISKDWTEKFVISNDVKY